MQSSAFDDRILIAHDDPQTGELLSGSLTREGFHCVSARDECEALDLASKNRLCLVVLGFAETAVRDAEICRRVRSLSSVPILILSARGEAADVVRGLAAGADDYVVKPFRLPELVARVKALVRRGGMRPLAHTVSHGEITLDLNRRSVMRRGERVSLTSSELKILEVLIAAPGRVFSRKELLLYLYPSGGVVIERVIDVHVQKLRAKLEHDRARPRCILTARGLGYRFADADEFSSREGAEELASRQTQLSYSGAVAASDGRVAIRSSHDASRGADVLQLTSLMRKSM